jgi:hypothetical protein
MFPYQNWVRNLFKMGVRRIEHIEQWHFKLTNNGAGGAIS